MKKVFAMICIFIMLVSLIGCSQEASNQKSEEELRAEIKAEMEAEAAKEAEQKSKFENETTHGSYVNFDDYAAVIAIFYEGVNKDKLNILEYSIGPEESFGVGTYTLQFAVFGKMENVRFDYHLGMFADPDPIIPIGTIENALVIVHAELPLDGAHIMVRGTVGGREIEFSIDEWREDTQVTPVERNIYKIAVIDQKLAPAQGSTNSQSGANVNGVLNLSNLKNGDNVGGGLTIKDIDYSKSEGRASFTLAGEIRLTGEISYSSEPWDTIYFVVSENNNLPAIVIEMPDDYSITHVPDVLEFRNENDFLNAISSQELRELKEGIPMRVEITIKDIASDMLYESEKWNSGEFIDLKIL